METLWHDVRFATRQFRSAPGFTAVIVFTIALGIAANTTVFAVINTLFLNPLPVGRPHELVTVRTTVEGTPPGEALAISRLNLEDIRARNVVFQDLAGHSSPMVLGLTGGDTPQRLFGEIVTGNYFDTLAIVPSLGRFFRPDEDVTPGASPVLVLAHAAWLARFGAAPDIVGRTVRINGLPFTVVGVAPKGFKGVDAVFGPDVWIPSMMADTVLPAAERDWLRNRAALAFRGVARLKPGRSPQQAGENLAAIAAVLEQEHPEANRGRGLAVERLSRAALLAPGRMSSTAISAVLLAIPALILLIACSNVANLLLARAASRRQEIAVRLALGSDRRRLLRQLVTESLLLSSVSGVAGWALAYAGVQLLWSFRPDEVAANLIDLDLDVTVVLFAAVLAVVTGVLFGLVPAMQSTRADVAGTLGDSHRLAGVSRRRLTIGNSLIAAQVALSLVSLVTAGLLLRSLQQAYRIDPGFETSRLGIALVSPGQAGYDRARSEQFFGDIRRRLAAVAGVESVSWATQLPLFARPTRTVMVDGQDSRESAGIITIVNAVDVDYFTTMGMGSVRGRDFTDADREGARPVAIVNEELASRIWPGRNPIGQRIRLAGDSMAREIVGVSRNANYGALGEAPQPCLFLPIRQEFSDAAVLYVRTAADPAAVLGTVQQIVRSADPHIDVNDVRTIETLIGQSLFGASMGVGLLALFGVVALGLASLGLYGAMAFAVRQRRREIGVRMAVGARRHSVIGLVLRQGMAPVAAGIVVGGAGAAATGQLISGMLFGVTPIDPISFAIAAAVLVLAASAACLLPAHRASRVDPIAALREP